MYVQFQTSEQARLHAIEECYASKERVWVELGLLREKQRVEIEAPKDKLYARAPAPKQINFCCDLTNMEPITPTAEVTFDQCHKPTPVKAKIQGTIDSFEQEGIITGGISSQRSVTPNSL